MKEKNCSKCGNKILVQEFYRWTNNSDGNQFYCSKCFAFLVSRYSMWEDWSQYNLTEKEKEFLEIHNKELLFWL